MGIAAVTMAASMFAVDLSAQLKFDGSLLDMSFDDASKASAITVNKPSGRKPWDATGLDFAVSGEKAGATINLDASGSAVGYSLWTKVSDNVTVKLGDLDYNWNVETIDWGGKINGAGSNGVACDINAGAFSASVLLNPGFGNAWFANKNINDTAVYVKYGADFGTLGLAYIGKPSAKAHNISAGYKGNFGGVGLFTDVAFAIADKQQDVKADVFVNGNADAFGYAAYAQMDYDVTGSKVANVQALAKFTYALDGFTPYLYLKDGDLLAKDFAATIKPGVTFSLGGAAADVAVAINVAKTTSISVPFSVKLAY